MENNENNVQNQENKVRKGVSLPIVIILLIIVLGAGIGGGFLLSKGIGFNKEENNSANNIVVENNTTEQNKTSKKIDESKPWVYDAEYGKGNDIKKIEKWSSDEDLVVPFININSEDGKSTNEEIEKLYKDNYEKYASDYNDSLKKICTLSYKFYVNNNILSVVIKETNGVVPGGAGECPFHIYNFNINTLKKATNDELIAQSGFASIEEVNKSINHWLEIEKKKESFAGSFLGIKKDNYFIDENNQLNFIVTVGAAGTFDEAHIVTKVAENQNNSVTESKNTTTNNETSKTQKEYAKEYLKIIDEVKAKYPNTDLKYDLIYFNNDNIPDLVIGVSGYWVSLYVYEDGKVYNPIDEWSYGAMGNVGYDYLEKKGAIYNYNSDFAGGVGTSSISIYNSKHELDTLSHRDKGADMVPTDPMYEEVQKDLEKTAGYYYNDQKISEQEFNNKVKEMSVSTDSKDYKTLDGSKSIEEIKSQLK